MDLFRPGVIDYTTVFQIVLRAFYFVKSSNLEILAA